jgi:hypothetical protein
MANIHKGRKRLKDTTIESIIDSKRPLKQQVFMGNTNSGLILDPATTHAIERNKMIDATTREFEARKTYNNNLINLDPLYSELRPLESFIVRLAVLPLDIDEVTGILMSQPRTVPIYGAQGVVKDRIIDPWQFGSEAVIVSVPEREQFIKPGDIMQIVTPKSMLDGEQIVSYEACYLHPSYHGTQVPKLMNDPHFGYAIIPRSWLKVILGESYYEKFLKV